MLQAIAVLLNVNISVVTLLYLQDIATGAVLNVSPPARLLAGGVGSLGWAAGFGVNTTAAAAQNPSALSPADMVQSAQACFNNPASYRAVFGPVAASVAQQFGVPASSIFGLLDAQVRSCVLCLPGVCYCCIL